MRNITILLLPVLLLSACTRSATPDGARADFGVEIGNGRVLYVSATAAAGGDGSVQRPFASLQALEAASAEGDTLVVLPAPLDTPALDGGIALKRDQRLIGGGPAVLERPALGPVAGASPLTALPRVRNTGLIKNLGDAIQLAPGARVENIVITESRRGAIYGLNVPGAVVRGNDVSGYNTDCFIGFTVQPFVAPTRAPYLGIPLALPAGWAGIMVDADTGSGHVEIRDNYVHDSACGNGIDLRLSGSADYSADISGNFVTQLKLGPLGFTREFHLVHAITTQIIDQARMVAYSSDNLMTYIGGPGADCEGLFMNLSHTGRGDWTIDRNEFEHGIGGFSCNGMELVVSHGSPHGEMRIANSRFTDNPGDMLQQDNLGRGSTTILELDNVHVRDTTERSGSPENNPLPFNLGECILMGSTGTDNTTILRVRDSTFENCSNGITILSGVSIENGPGPDGLIEVDIRRSRFANNATHNLIFGAIAPLRELRIRAEDSDFAHSGESVVAFKLVNLGRVETATLDFGGGALGSTGGNCLHGAQTGPDVESDGLPALLRGNWWGQPGGPDPARLGGSSAAQLDTGAALATRPTHCAP